MDERTTGPEPEDYRTFGEATGTRKPGTGRFRRPFSSGNPATARENGSGETEEIEERTGASIRAGRQELGRGAKRDSAKPAQTITATSAKQAAQRAVGLINTATVTFVSRDAEMTRDERDNVAEPLAAILQRNAGVAEGLGRWADPLALVIALSVWAMRAYLVYRKERIALARAELAQRQAAYAHAPDIQTIRDQPDQPVPPVAPAPNERLSVTDIQSRMAR